MKKILLLIITIMLISISSVSAQTVWGARVGVSRPTVSGPGGSLDGKFGLEIGPVLYHSLKNNWYINSGAMFSIKTFDLDEGSLNMYYVDVPLYIGYSFPVGKLSLYAQAGPYVGFKISEDVSIDDYYSDGDAESGLNSFNAGLGFMGGVNINRFKIELGYQAGLMNVADDTDDYSLKLGSIFLGVSYIF